jgi:hypothetical protein
VPTDGRRLSGRRSERGGDCSQAPWGARRKEVIADLESNLGSKAGDVASRSGSPSPSQNDPLEPEFRAPRKAGASIWNGPRSTCMNRTPAGRRPVLQLRASGDRDRRSRPGSRDRRRNGPLRPRPEGTRPRRFHLPPLPPRWPSRSLLRRRWRLAHRPARLPGVSPGPR